MDGSSTPVASERIPWMWIIPVVLGAVIGVPWGTSWSWLDSGPGGGMFPATFGLTIVAFFGLGGAGLLAVVLALPRRTRPASAWLVCLMAGAFLGGVVGIAVGPRYQFGGDVLGTVTFELTGPSSTTLTADAICEIQDNGTDIETIVVPALGRIGVDSLSATFGIVGYGTSRVLVNEGSGYEGSLAMTSTGETAVGTGSFTSTHADRYRLGGEHGAETISANLSWTCGTTPAPTPEPDGSRVSADPMQGWFSLGGVVDLPHPCAGDGACRPYGRVIATCFRDVPHRANHIETVVPWIGSSRARLTLDLQPDAASLTVETDDDAPVEVVAGLPTWSESGQGVVDRVVAVDVQLARGPLHVEVEYSCSDNVEP